MTTDHSENPVIPEAHTAPPHPTDRLIGLFTADAGVPDVAEVHALIGQGANPNVIFNHGMTLLMLAARKGYADAAEALVAGGANINTPNPISGATALHVAARADHPEMLRLLAHHGANLWAADHEGLTALHAAASGGKTAATDALLALGMDINTQGKNDITPLILACRHASAAMVEWLLKRGANPNMISAFGHAPLILASHRGDADAVQALLDHGVDLHYKDAEGHTALHDAAAGAHAQVVTALLSAGAKPDIQDAIGFTPLHSCAVANKDHKADEVRETIRLLSAAQASLNLRDFSDGYTALKWAIAFNHDAAAVALMDQGAYVSPDLCLAYGLAAQRHEAADAIWQQLVSGTVSCEQLTPLDVVYLANIGHHQQVLNPALWAGKTDQLMELLLALPGSLQKQIVSEQPDLMLAFATPENQVITDTIERVVTAVTTPPEPPRGR